SAVWQGRQQPLTRRTPSPRCSIPRNGRRTRQGATEHDVSIRTLNAPREKPRQTSAGQAPFNWWIARHDPFVIPIYGWCTGVVPLYVDYALPCGVNRDQHQEQCEPTLVLSGR